MMSLERAFGPSRLVARSLRRYPQPGCSARITFNGRPFAPCRLFALQVVGPETPDPKSAQLMFSMAIPGDRAANGRTM
jgi:hypothetical protein